jgi:flagellar basal-body rod protein FlgC
MDLHAALVRAASGMEAQAQRLRHVSENVANADTPGYRRKLVEFRVDRGEGTVAAGPVRLDRRELERLHDPGHPLADAEGYRDGSNVDLVVELADAREAQRSYEANLKLFDHARQMTQSLFDLLRR